MSVMRAEPSAVQHQLLPTIIDRAHGCHSVDVQRGSGRPLPLLFGNRTFDLHQLLLVTSADYLLIHCVLSVLQRTEQQDR